MAHCADRVADLVRDAGAQAPERCQFRLLHARVEDAGVLEKNQQRAIPIAAFAERGEVSGDPGAGVLVDQCKFRVRRQGVVLAPAAHVVGQRLGSVAERPGSEQLGRAEQPRGRRVIEADLVVGVHDDDAFAQMLHDVLIQLGEILQVDATLARERFTLLYAASERTHRQGDREDDGREYSGRRVVDRGCRPGELREYLLAENCKRCRCADDRRDLAGQYEAARTDEYDKQPAEPAADAAAGVHQRYDEDDIDE
jgi:hypothetical protein